MEFTKIELSALWRALTDCQTYYKQVAATAPPRLRHMLEVRAQEMRELEERIEQQLEPL